jgi:4'-phosphopantetheinyl transferase EntD
MKVLAERLPASVAVVESFGDVCDVPLFDAEERAIRNAVVKRRSEFATVRHCARLALANLGIDAGPIAPGQRGAPAWPPGVVGSMTHCQAYRAAAVARDADVRGLGIDAEPNQPLPEGVLDLVSSAAERRHLDGLAADEPTIAWDRLLFSAKESIYKTWFPLAREWLGFEEEVHSVVRRNIRRDNPGRRQRHPPPHVEADGPSSGSGPTAVVVD